MITHPPKHKLIYKGSSGRREYAEPANYQVQKAKSQIMFVCEMSQRGKYLHVIHRKEFAWPCIPGQRSSTTVPGWAEVGEGGALPGDGADEGNEVPRRQASNCPCKEAGVEGVAATLGKVDKCQSNSLRCIKISFFCGIYHWGIGTYTCCVSCSGSVLSSHLVVCSGSWAILCFA